MKRITNLITHGQEFILASTTTADAFAKMGKFVAIRAEDVTDGQTNRPLTGLDVITADTLPELGKNCERFAKHSEWMKAHPPPTTDTDSPEFLEWIKKDFAEYAKQNLTA